MPSAVIGARAALQTISVVAETAVGLVDYDLVTTCAPVFVSPIARHVTLLFNKAPYLSGMATCLCSKCYSLAEGRERQPSFNRFHIL